MLVVQSGSARVCAPMSDTPPLPTPLVVGTILAVRWHGSSLGRRHGQPNSSEHVGYGVYLGPEPRDTGRVDVKRSLRLLWMGRIARFETVTGVWSFTAVTRA